MSKDLAEENWKLKQQIRSLKAQVNELTTIIKLQQNQLFEKKTEVIESVADRPQSLFSNDELVQLQDSDVSITEVTEKRENKWCVPILLNFCPIISELVNPNSKARLI